jgi:hypothetical protein
MSASRRLRVGAPAQHHDGAYSYRAASRHLRGIEKRWRGGGAGNSALVLRNNSSE